MTTQNEDRDVFQSQCFDPFPEPRTIPSGWDISVFFSAPKTDSVTDSDSSTENETH